MSEDTTQQSEQSTGITGEIKEAFHKLEDGIEHLIEGAKEAAQDDPPLAADPQSDLASEGNADASNAEQSSENGMQASAMSASTADGTQGAQNRPVSTEQAEGAIAKLRAHLWTFSHGAVSMLHTELDKLETFVKSA